MQCVAKTNYLTKLLKENEKNYVDFFDFFFFRPMINITKPINRAAKQNRTKTISALNPQAEPDNFPSIVSKQVSPQKTLANDADINVSVNFSKAKAYNPPTIK